MPTASFKQLDLNEILRQAVFLQRIGHPEIEYDLALPEEPTIVECDGRLVSQALTNILKNAAEAIRGHDSGEDEDDAEAPRAFEGKIGRIRLTILPGENSVTIVATDSGCGLPDNNRSRLTEPYMTTHAKGTGLGLAIVNKVMEDHAGELVLEDAPADEGWESGARVRLVFPRRRHAESSGRHGKTRNAEDVAGDASEEAVNGV
jgi:two-component system nitrogen regulation sensor histidine kinase NtrY